MQPKLRFNFPGDYSCELIKDVFNVMNNNSYSREELCTFGNIKNIHYGDIHTKLNKVTNVKDEDLLYLSQKNEKKLTELCKDYDILIADASEDYSDIGKAVQLTNVIDCVAGLHTILARPKEKSLYFTYLLSSWFVRKQFMRFACGAKVLGLSKASLQKVLLPLPNLAEQNKIATFLNLYYKKIELQKQKIDLLKLLLKQKINDSFSQKNDSPKIKLSNLINQISIRNKNNLDLPVLSVSNKNGFVPQNEQFEEEVASEDKSGYKIIKINQFAYNPARINVGSIARLKDKYNIGQISPMYICFECCNKIYNDYFEYYLNSQTFKKEMTKRLEGSVRMCLSFDSLCNIKISLPDFNQQKIIATNLSLIKNKIDIEEQKLTFMKTYKQGLLQQMFV